MGFLSPWFLLGGLAAALPVYLHLLRQHKSTPLPFSSLMFFERRTQSSVKHRRLRYLLLMSARIAILILLALLFANPYIRLSSAPGAGKRLLLLAIDKSFSMRAGDRMEQARRQALSAVDSLRPGDQGQVITFDSRVSFATQATDDANALRAAVQGVQPGDGRSSYGELSRGIRSIAKSSRLPVQVHVFTDAQRTSLPSPFSELSLGENTALTVHALAAKQVPNWFVETVESPKSVYQAKQVRIRSTVAGAGTEASTLNAALWLNGQSVQSKSVAVPANGRGSMEFFLNDAPYGLNRGEIRIDSRDGLAADDRMGFAIERKEAGRILFVHEARQPRGLLYYKSALDAIPNGAFAVDAVTTEQASNIDPAKYSFVVLSDTGTLPPAFEEALGKRIRSGGALLVALGPVSAARKKVPVMGEDIAETRYSSRSGERFQTVGWVDTAHPALQNTNALDGVQFYQTVGFQAGSGRVLARLTDQSPLLVERKLGEGRVLVFASTFDNISNDLPLHTAFVPFIERTADYLGGIEENSADYPVGSYLELRSNRDQGSAVEVIGPDGQRALSLNESVRAQAFRLEHEGVYEVRRGNARNELIAVHPDRRESDLSPIPPETLALWQGTGRPGGSAASSAETTEAKPASIWWYFALALLLMALAESVIASRHMEVESDVEQVTRKAAA